MVIGGGPAGMEAARVLALRGHRVVLYEKGAKLGGQVNLAVIPPHKEELRNILDYLVFQLEKLNVEVHLGREATAETVTKERPDAIIVATGALPLFPEIPGLERERLFTPGEALEGDRPMGEKIIVIGGGMVGCEVAEYLAGKGKQVTIIEKLSEVASGMEGHTRRLLLERLKSLSVQMITGAEVLSLQGRNAIRPESRKNHRSGNGGGRSGYGSQGRPHLRGISVLRSALLRCRGLRRSAGHSRSHPRRISGGHGNLTSMDLFREEKS